MPALVACAAADFIVLGPPQAVLGPPWAVLGPSKAIVYAISFSFGCVILRTSRPCLALWGALGYIIGHLGRSDCWRLPRFGGHLHCQPPLGGYFVSLPAPFINTFRRPPEFPKLCGVSYVVYVLWCQLCRACSVVTLCVHRNADRTMGPTKWDPRGLYSSRPSASLSPSSPPPPRTSTPP